MNPAGVVRQPGLREQRGGRMRRRGRRGWRPHLLLLLLPPAVGGASGMPGQQQQKWSPFCMSGGTAGRPELPPTRPAPAVGAHPLRIFWLAVCVPILAGWWGWRGRWHDRPRVREQPGALGAVADGGRGAVTMVGGSTSRQLSSASSMQYASKLLMPGGLPKG
jgi:hypothetical protein